MRSGFHITQAIRLVPHNVTFQVGNQLVYYDVKRAITVRGYDSHAMDPGFSAPGSFLTVPLRPPSRPPTRHYRSLRCRSMES